MGAQQPQALLASATKSRVTGQVAAIAAARWCGRQEQSNCIRADTPVRACVQWLWVMVFIAGSMFLASLHRVVFSVLAVPFAVRSLLSAGTSLVGCWAATHALLQDEFSLSTVQVGQLQSAVLAGYVLGQVGVCRLCKLATRLRQQASQTGVQVPAGVVADLIGGPRVMVCGVAAWCCITGT